METDLEKEDGKRIIYREVNGGNYNRIMEIRATAFGLSIDNQALINWAWVLEALAQTLKDDPYLEGSMFSDEKMPPGFRRESHKKWQ